MFTIRKSNDVKRQVQQHAATSELRKKDTVKRYKICERREDSQVLTCEEIEDHQCQ